MNDDEKERESDANESARARARARNCVREVRATLPRSFSALFQRFFPRFFTFFHVFSLDFQRTCSVFELGKIMGKREERREGGKSAANAEKRGSARSSRAISADF